MEITFSYDKQEHKPHFQVNHCDISEDEILEVFSNQYIKSEVQNRITKIVGHTANKKFIVIVGIFNKNKTSFRVITAYPATRKYIILWNNEVNKK